MAEPTIIFRSPEKSTSSSIRCSSPTIPMNSPTHNNPVIVFKDNNSDHQQQQSTSTVKS